MGGACMCAGAPLVPVFVFGQSAAYSWVKLGPPFLPQWLAQRIARAIGFLPLLMYGVWGSPLPHPVRLCPNKESRRAGSGSFCLRSAMRDKKVVVYLWCR